MDNLRWRGKARVVGYVDLILTSMGLVFVLLCTVFAGALTAAAATDQGSGEIDPESAKILAIVMWIAVAVAAILTGIQLWAAVKLLNATQVGLELHEALSNAATWRNVTVVFLIFQIVGGLSMGDIVGTVIGVVMRGIFLYVVYEFMSEVESSLTMSSMSGPTVVTVKI